jgi:hypothetical protein
MAKADEVQQRARELCIAAGIDPDSRPDGGRPAWLHFRDQILQEAAAVKAAEKAAFVPTPPAFEKPPKPLNTKAYGSIGHLPASRMGPGDWHVHEGQHRICCVQPRKGDRVIVTEKLDGACMSVANIDGTLVSLSRAGFRADDALYPHLRAFAPYVDRRTVQFDFLKPGERIVGEWLALAHGTIYDIGHPDFAPFIAFDIFRGGERILRDEFVQRTADAEIMTAHLIHDGATAISVAPRSNLSVRSASTAPPNPSRARSGVSSAKARSISWPNTCGPTRSTASI